MKKTKMVPMTRALAALAFGCGYTAYMTYSFAKTAMMNQAIENSMRMLPHLFTDKAENEIGSTSGATMPR